MKKRGGQMSGYSGAVCLRKVAYVVRFCEGEGAKSGT